VLPTCAGRRVGSLKAPLAAFLGGGRAEPPFSHVVTRPVDIPYGPYPNLTRLSPCGASLVRRGLQFHWLYV
jgi:hypothetical protein